jgi:amidase
MCGMERREFLAIGSLSLAASALPPPAAEGSRSEAESLSPRTPATGAAGHDLDFASALQAADAIRERKVSSVELTRRAFERIDHHNPALNAFAFQLRDEALAAARRADEALARGRSLGVFHGVPVHVKESFGVAGRPCTWGIAALRDSKTPRNSEVVARLLGAGAVLIGATNVPVNLSDWQSYNAIYGTTNSPWDLKRTPGGSSGGTAAALAAGLGYLSVGSDIGGSIRVPAHFCGIYGHKPTLDLVSAQGQQPGGDWGSPGFSTLLAVAGPMARSAGDLLAAMNILGGPVGWDAKAWRWELPLSRGRSLRDFRVGYVLDDPIAPLTPEMKSVLEPVITRLERAGAKLKAGWPAGYRPAELLDNYLFHLFAFLETGAPPGAQEAQRKELANFKIPRAGASLSSFSDWQQQNHRRLAFRAQWQSYFEEVDVFLSPVAFTPAFPHDHSEPQGDRTIATPDGPRRYVELLNWIAAATLTGCPATSAPVGRTQGGLPVGIQIMGPYWEDATPITFAELLARETGGFMPPPGYAN